MSKLSAILCFFAALGSSMSFSQDDKPILPINISFDLNQLKASDFGTDSLDGEQLLFRLFPAPMNEDDPELSEWKTAAYWSCSSCLKKEFVVFEDEEGVEKEILPFDGNYTTCTTILYYQSEKGSLRAIASFSTSQLNDGTGRFTRGLLSLANFEKQDGRWRLLHFNPFVNFQGSFTLASAVDQVLINKMGKTYFLIHGGEANGVSPEDYWPLYQGLYVIEGESLSEIIHISGASCRENNDAVGSVWETEITDIAPNSMGTVIKTKTSGLIVKAYNWYLPDVLQFISTADFENLPARFNFTATQKHTSTPTGLNSEKPSVSIQYTDSGGILREQIITTQNTRIK